MALEALHNNSEESV